MCHNNYDQEIAVSVKIHTPATFEEVLPKLHRTAVWSQWWPASAQQHRLEGPCPVLARDGLTRGDVPHFEARVAARVVGGGGGGGGRPGGVARAAGLVRGLVLELAVRARPGGHRPAGTRIIESFPDISSQNT